MVRGLNTCAGVLPPLACPTSLMRPMRGCTALALSSVMRPPRAPPGAIAGRVLACTRHQMSMVVRACSRVHQSLSLALSSRLGQQA